MKNEERLNNRENVPPIGINKNGTPITAIVVDDVFTERRIMAQILRSSGFNVLGEAENGFDGIKMTEELKPQLIILDYYMPKMDGLNALVHLKKSFPSIYIIMSTAEGDKEMVTKIMKSGADEYILKPLDRRVILHKLEVIVELMSK